MNLDFHMHPTYMYQSAVLEESDIVMYYYFMQAFLHTIQLLTMHSLNAIKTEKVESSAVSPMQQTQS